MSWYSDDGIAREQRQGLPSSQTDGYALAVICLLSVTTLLSLFQSFIGVLSFTYVVTSQGLVIGQIVALLAV